MVGLITATLFSLKGRGAASSTSTTGMAMTSTILPRATLSYVQSHLTCFTKITSATAHLTVSDYPMQTLMHCCAANGTTFVYPLSQNRDSEWGGFPGLSQANPQHKWRSSGAKARMPEWFRDLTQNLTAF